MSSSLPGSRELPASQYDLNTYMGRVRHAMGLTDPTTLFAGSAGLESAKQLVTEYKTGKLERMTPDLWTAKKVVDATLHPDTGEPVLLPFRMSSYVLTNLIVTAGMLQPGLKTVGIVGWQVANQSLNVAINSANANKSSPMTTAALVKSYFFAVGASCSVALGLNSIVPRLNVTPGTRAILGRLIPFAAVASAGGLNTYLMRRDEITKGIDVRPVLSEEDKAQLKAEGKSERDVPSLGRSHTAAKIAVYETAASRVLTGSPIMVIPPMVLYHIEQKQAWYRNLMQKEWVRARPTLVKAIPLSINLSLIAVTSFAVLPFALAVFPQQQEITAERLEPEFHGKGGKNGKVIFNRGL
ncbi:Sideroflexin FSF1 [Neonectria magnoliae]|uniref:Sideroflexin FSF1 n=1 Tax=Neonectria magnoliae TaxID=2732573 RepID=A0ABR1I572_9HYPO